MEAVKEYFRQRRRETKASEVAERPSCINEYCCICVLFPGNSQNYRLGICQRSGSRNFMHVFCWDFTVFGKIVKTACIFGQKLPQAFISTQYAYL